MKSVLKYKWDILMIVFIFILMFELIVLFDGGHNQQTDREECIEQKPISIGNGGIRYYYYKNGECQTDVMYGGM